MTIPVGELKITFALSSGKGGQNVQKRHTKAIVRWNVLKTKSISDAERQRIRRGLANRISREGWLRVTASAQRSQSQNLDEAVDRLNQLVSEALEEPKKRIETRLPHGAKSRRREEKERRGRLKKMRRERWGA